MRAAIYVPSSNGSQAQIDAYDNPPGEFARRAFHVRFFPDGRITYYRDQENPIPDIAIKTDAWQDVLIRADLKKATFDLTVDGMTVTDLPFGCDGIHRIQCLAIGPNSSNATLYVDAVKVEVSP